MMPNEKEWRSCPIFGEVKVRRCKKLLGALGNGGCAGCFPIQNMIWSSGPSASKRSVYWIRYHEGLVWRKGYNSVRIQSMDYLHAFRYALRASDHAICGLTMIFACISDSVFSDWFLLNSDNFWGVTANLITVCHGLSLRFPTMPKI